MQEETFAAFELKTSRLPFVWILLQSQLEMYKTSNLCIIIEYKGNWVPVAARSFKVELQNPTNFEPQKSAVSGFFYDLLYQPI